MSTTPSSEETTIELYVKYTSNYPGGYPLTSFTLLSPVWQGESLDIPFGDPDTDAIETHTVVGWTDLFGGMACRLQCAGARTRDGQNLEGYLIWGGNSGLRILDEEAEVQEWNSHLPAGYGRPFIWIEEVANLPEDVRQILFSEK